MSDAPAARPLPPPGGARYLALRWLFGTVAAAALAISALWWYSTTPAFEALVRDRLVATLEQATGGRVQLGYFHWRLRRLEFEADDLTIHGLEGPGEVPYAHIDRLFVQAKIVSLFRQEIGLRLLEGEHPVFHLIVYPDGSTNQPRPKTGSNRSVVNTIFDLAVNRTEIDDGVLLINQRAIPFNIAANDLALLVTFDSLRDHYLADLHAADLTAQRGKLAPVHSQLQLHADLSRTAAVLSQFKLQTGNSPKNGSVLEASGSLTDYANPRFALKVKGSIDVREVEALTAVPGLRRGIAQIQLQGNGSSGSFAIDGHAKVTGAEYRRPEARVNGVDASTDIHITQDELALTSLKARLPGGGTVAGELRLLNWRSTPPPVSLVAPPSSPPKGASAKTVAKLAAPMALPGEKGTIRAQIRGITLRDVLEITTPPSYHDLGFDTSANGSATVAWTGNIDDLTVGANVSLLPGSGRYGVPLGGAVDATYYNRRGAVDIRRLVAQTPGSHVQVEGSIGVYPLARPSSVQVDLTTTNLGEFDKTLTALGVSASGPGGKKTGVAAIPVKLEGEAEFHGTVTGSLLMPDVKGHLTATAFDTVFATPEEAEPPAHAPSLTAASAQTQPAPGQPSAAESSSPSALPAALTDIHWDSLTAQAEYSPAVISVQHATLLRGKTAIHLSGQLHAHESSRGHRSYNQESAIDATVAVQDAAIADLLAIAGSKAPVSGALALQAHVGGALDDLSGGGHLAVQGGEIYDQPYHSLTSDLKFTGQELDATNLKFLQDGGQIAGAGGYNFHARTVHFQAKGSGFDLEHLQQMHSAKVSLAGVLSFDASGSGPIDDPAAQASIHVWNFVVDNQYRGSLDGSAHLRQKQLSYQVDSALDAARFQIAGETELTGDYATQAQVTATQVHIERFLRMFNVRDVTSSSVLNMHASISGPAKMPKQLSGTIDVSQFAVSVGGVALKSEAPLHASLRDGLAHLDPLRITGDDTNLQAQGSIGVFGAPRLLDLHAKGAINLKLAQSFDPNVTGSGHVDFYIDAGGTMQLPRLAGQVKFTNVAMSLEDLPNGLSQMNGTLVFDQDRLTVQKLTAVTGGGRLELGGFITYQQGLYGDLTATGKDIRIRYPPGVSTMADAKLRLQGTETNLQLTGNVLVTRFAISPNLDLATLKSATGSATLPNPDSQSNHVRLNVHITSAPELNFQNSFAKLAGDVDLTVRGTIANPSILGHISVTDGSATFAGTTYQLQRGEIYFSNPIRIDPTIDLDATARVEDYDIDVGLHGTLSKLSLSYRSEPPLPEADVLALLTVGRTQEEQQIYSQEQQAAGVNPTADALLGGALNATVSSRVSKLFGAGSVKIDPNFVGNLGNSTARITVQERIGNNATLTYATNVNSTEEQLIQAQVYLTQNVSVVAQRDESGVFSLVLKIHQRAR